MLKGNNLVGQDLDIAINVSTKRDVDTSYRLSDITAKYARDFELRAEAKEKACTH